MNHSAKFDAPSFILAGEICNSTNKKQTVTNTFTPCLSACVDNKQHAHVQKSVWLDLYSSCRLEVSGPTISLITMDQAQ